MTDLLEVHRTGDAEIVAQFDATATAVKEGMRRALLESGNRIAALAAAGAPSGATGALRRSVRVRLFDEGAGKMRLRVWFRAYYADFLESGVVSYGTAHNAREAGGKRQRIRHMVRLRESGNHWRIKPMRFMAKAVAQVEPTIPAVLERALGEELQKV